MSGAQTGAKALVEQTLLTSCASSALGFSRGGFTSTAPCRAVGSRKSKAWGAVQCRLRVQWGAAQPWLAMIAEQVLREVLQSADLTREKL